MAIHAVVFAFAGTRPGGRPLFLKRVKKRGKRIAPRCTGLTAFGCPRYKSLAGPASQTCLRLRTATPDFPGRTFLRSAAQKGFVCAIVTFMPCKYACGI